MLLLLRDDVATRNFVDHFVCVDIPVFELHPFYSHTVSTLAYFPALFASPASRPPVFVLTRGRHRERPSRKRDRPPAVGFGADLFHVLGSPWHVPGWS